jgi:hypothetical protein
MTQTQDQTVNVAAYPSAELRPIPAFAFAVPNRFVIEEAPDAIAVARTEEEVDGFWVNAIISVDKVRSEVKLAEAAAVSLARLKRRAPDAEVMTERLGAFDGREVYIRGVQLTAPQGDRKLGQVHALFFAPGQEGQRLRFLFQIVGTCPAEKMEEYGPLFVLLVRSFKFAPPPNA